MLSYAASGAKYKIGFFLPFIVVTFVASFVVQEMSMPAWRRDTPRLRRTRFSALRPILGLAVLWLQASSSF